MADSRLSILALSAYHGGPRAEFLQALAAHSRHEMVQLTLPARTWAWRLRGSALHFADEIARIRRPRFDIILATDLVDAARLRALLPPALRATPIVQYFHDDVLSTDLKDHLRDEPLAVAQLYSIAAADAVLVASEHHRQAILAGAARLMATFPDAVPANLPARLQQAIRVLSPGVDAAAIRAARPRAKPDGPPVILWNNPWTDEQNPALFFETLDQLEQEEIDFRLIAVGIAVRKYPDVFREARERFARHVLQFGYVPGREQYLANIRAADVVVSTARREWFPLATVEAAVAGAYPLVGRGLANSEVFGDALDRHGYRGPVDLRRKLARLLTGRDDPGAARELQDRLAARYDWPAVANQFDAAIAAASAAPPARP